MGLKFDRLNISRSDIFKCAKVKLVLATMNYGSRTAGQYDLFRG